MFYATFNNVSVFFHTCAVVRSFRRLMFMPLSIFSHFPHLWCIQGGSRGSCFMPLSILFQSFTTSVLQAKGLMRLMFYATFNNVSVIYQTFAVGRGSEGSCFMSLTICSHLAHLCCRQGGSRGLWFMPLLIFFQEFTTHVLQAGGSGGSCFMTLSILFQSFTTTEQQAGWLRRRMFFATFNNVSVF